MDTDREHLKDTPRELDSRTGGDGIEVALNWRERDNALFVTVRDAVTGRDHVLAVDPATALEVFRHPYPHLAGRRRPATPVAAG